MNIWTSSIHDIHVHDNFADKTNVNNHGTNCLVENNTMNEKPNALSPGAREIAENAGLESAYSDVKLKIPLPAIEVINDSDPAIIYTGPWSSIGGRPFGDVHSTGQNGASASFPFSGYAIDFVTEVNSDEGDVAVSIDGAQVQTISCQSPNRAAQKMVFHTSWPQEGKHEIKLEKKSGAYLVVDAFKVYHHPSP
jgi:hypothetical protein